MWGQTPTGHWIRLETVQEQPPPLRLDVHRLSNVAFAILRTAPDAFRDGQPVSLRTWCTLTGYKSLAHIRAGLLELAGRGLVEVVPYGARRQYTGSALLWHPQVLALAA